MSVQGWDGYAEYIGRGYRNSDRFRKLVLNSIQSRDCDQVRPRDLWVLVKTSNPKRDKPEGVIVCWWYFATPTGLRRFRSVYRSMTLELKPDWCQGKRDETAAYFRRTVEEMYLWHKLEDA